MVLLFNFLLIDHHQNSCVRSQMVSVTILRAYERTSAQIQLWVISLFKEVKLSPPSVGRLVWYFTGLGKNCLMDFSETSWGDENEPRNETLHGSWIWISGSFQECVRISLSVWEDAFVSQAYVGGECLWKRLHSVQPNSTQPSKTVRVYRERKLKQNSSELFLAVRKVDNEPLMTLLTINDSTDDWFQL